MKLVIFYLLTIASILSCSNQNIAIVTFEDDKTNEIKAHFEDYASGNIDGMLSRWSDDLSILTNEGVVGLKEVKELLPLHHTLFSEINFTYPDSEEKGFYAETTDYPDGTTWTKTWYKWHAVGNFTNNEVSSLGMIGFRWDNGKIVEEHHFEDSSVFEAELNAYQASL